MSRLVKRSLGFSVAVALALCVPVADAQQPYGGYRNWDAVPPAGDVGPGGDYGWRPHAEPESPTALLRDAMGSLTNFLDSRPNRGALVAYVEQQVAPWFDFDYMAEWAAGRSFRRLDPAQQADLTGRLRESFLDKMAQKLARYSQQRTVILSPQSDAPGEVTLPMVIENPSGGYPARMEFRLRQTAKGWRVIDVSANGMSALLHYRQLFGEMQRQRPQMPPPMRPY
jgi:phospholipid transport system substrate-binding protein